MTDRNATTDTSQDKARQKSSDRRQQPTPMLSRFTFFGRRRINRRTVDPTANYYVDKIEGRNWLALITVMVLCGLDGILTLKHLNLGGEELNPAMDFVIRVLGETPFLFIKYTMTGVGMLFLMLHKNFRAVRYLIRLIVTVYVLLIAYHVVVIIFRRIAIGA